MSQVLPMTFHGNIFGYDVCDSVTMLYGCMCDWLIVDGHFIRYDIYCSRISV